MKYIKLGLGQETVDQKVAQGNSLVTGLTGNVNFSSINPSAATLNTKTAALLAAKVARDNAVAAAKAATVTLHNAEADFDLTLTKVALSCEAAVLGDVVKLEGAGFVIRADATPIGSLAQVTNLRVTSNTYSGKLFLRWTPVRGAKSYEVQICADPLVVANYVSLQPSPGSSITLEDLPSATRQWLRVRAIAKNSQGPWSVQVDKVVP